MPAAQTYLIAHTTAEERPAKMAMIGMMFGVGMIIGPAAGSAMVSAGILVPIVFSALIMLLPLPFVVNKLKGTPSQNRQSGPVEKLRFTDSKIRPYFILMITVYAIFSAIQQTIAFSIQDLLSLDAVSTAQWGWNRLYDLCHCVGYLPGRDHSKMDLQRQSTNNDGIVLDIYILGNFLFGSRFNWNHGCVRGIGGGWFWFRLSRHY